MRQLAILGPDRSSAGVIPGTEGVFTLEDMPVRYGLVETDDPVFDATNPENAELVQFRVKAFSCNYRDRSLILKAATSEFRRGYYVVGSDFVGEVIAVGTGVTDLEPGDRVIADNAYHAPEPGATFQPGIPTNHGSKEIQVLHHRKLMKVPSDLTDIAAGSFSIGAQTAYSMVRKLDLKPGERVLVTGAKSNTSLFVIAALRDLGVDVTGLSTSTRHEEHLLNLGMSDLIVADPSDPNWVMSASIRDKLVEKGGFDAIVDPFSDVYMPGLFGVMAFGSRYTTCGVADQHTHLIGKESFGNTVRVGEMMSDLLSFNITFLGNCLGLREDLQSAVEDAAAGRFAINQLARTSTVDPGDFFQSTYLDRDRFGKVTFVYE